MILTSKDHRIQGVMPKILVLLYGFNIVSVLEKGRVFFFFVKMSNKTEKYPKRGGKIS